MSDKETYAEMLKDPRWVEMSKEIKEWDRGVCQLCGDNSNLQVHHLCYRKDRAPWEYPRRALVTLCGKCHKKLHECDKKFYEHLNDIIFELGLNGVSKNTILHILSKIWQESFKHKESSVFDDIWCPPYSEPFWVFGREYKNNIYAKHREDERDFLRLAKEAYMWSTDRKDFNEEKAINGEYDEYVSEYKREFYLD